MLFLIAWWLGLAAGSGEPGKYHSGELRQHMLLVVNTNAMMDQIGGAPVI